MTALPAPLARWATELAGMPGELITAIAPWLGRLSMAIGPLPGDRGAAGGEPDGLGGLSRRGSYERLLMSEWAIAEEWPDEFLRRAASGEHLFVARAHRAPPATRRSVVLVSAGPSQIGAPRLVHLAALVVMARRAAAGGAELAWGVIERPAAGLDSSVEPASLAGMLAARTATTPGPDQAVAWRAVLDRAGGADTDVWLIGGDELAAVARDLGAGVLVVRDPFEPAVAALDVEVTDRAALKPRARIRLPLPDPDEGARLVRDPFRRAVTTATASKVAGAIAGVWFVAGGRRLAVQYPDRIELWPIPTSPREPPGKPRKVTIDHGHVLVALGAQRKVPIVATWTAAHPHLLYVRDPSFDPHPIEVALPTVVSAMIGTGRAPTRSIPGLCARVRLWRGASEAQQVTVIDGLAGAILVVSRHQWRKELTATVLGLDEDVNEAEVVGAASLDPGILFARVEAGGVVELRKGDDVGVRMVARVQRRGVGSDDELGGVRFGFSIPSRGTWGPVAVRVDGKRWEVVEGGSLPVTIESEAPVHGAITRSGDVRLLCEDEGARRLVLRGRADTVQLPRAGDRIGAVACSSSLPVVAWATSREVIVYSMRYQAVVLRISREDP